MRCIFPEGCPCDGCDADGECYLARCERPNAPKPITDEDLLAEFAKLVLRVNLARLIS